MFKYFLLLVFNKGKIGFYVLFVNVLYKNFVNFSSEFVEKCVSSNFCVESKSPEYGDGLSEKTKIRVT